jgi:hypothetical protein
MMKVTIWRFVSNMHEGMNDCTHLLSYLNTVLSVVVEYAGEVP